MIVSRLRRRSWPISLVAILFLVMGFFYLSTGHHKHLVVIAKGKLGWNGQSLPPEKMPPRPIQEPGFYDWTTKSAFEAPNVDNVGNASISDLCQSFPSHLLDDVQPILKTGHNVVSERVSAQLSSVSACLSNLLIFSDAEEDFQGHHIIDVIADIPAHLRDFESQLRPWSNGAVIDGSVESKKAWKMDKFKFLPAISRAWKESSGKKWYVFYEADTYVVWDSVFRLLENFDPDEAYYFGSPSPGRQKTWFANGGPGYILSRESMRRLTASDYDPDTGAYLGSKLAEKHWYNVWDDCCGDSILGWALINANITLSGLFPMFNPHTPHGVPFSDRMWCQPIMTMHKPFQEDMLGLWRWEWAHRQPDRPLLYRDLATSYLQLGKLSTKQNWRNNAAGVGYLAPETETHPHESPESCEAACKADEWCYCWTHHWKECHFVHSIRLGREVEPSVEEDEGGVEVEAAFVAGWDNEKIARWMNERPCAEVEWLKPSWDRHV